MTKAEYEQYTKSVDKFMTKEGLDNLSVVGSSEPQFSWSPCHCCKRTEAGNRYDCDGFNPSTGKVQDGYFVCEDCVYYADMGHLDDVTMAAVEEDGKTRVDADNGIFLSDLIKLAKDNDVDPSDLFLTLCVDEVDFSETRIINAKVDAENQGLGRKTGVLWLGVKPEVLKTLGANR